MSGRRGKGGKGLGFGGAFKHVQFARYTEEIADETVKRTGFDKERISECLETVYKEGLDFRERFRIVITILEKLKEDQTYLTTLRPMF